MLGARVTPGVVGTLVVGVALGACEGAALGDGDGDVLGVASRKDGNALPASQPRGKEAVLLSSPSNTLTRDSFATPPAVRWTCQCARGQHRRALVHRKKKN